MKERIKRLLNRQEIRFIFVGGLNTLIGYGLYALFVYIGINYLVSNTIATIIGVIHSFIWNKYFTFRSNKKIKDEVFKFISVYLISYTIGMITLYIIKDVFNISPYIAGLINLVITTLISFFGHKYISFNSK